MIRKLTLLHVVVCLAAALIFGCAHAQSGSPGGPMDALGPQRCMVAGEATAYLVMPGALISGGSVERAEWSPDGNCIALVRTAIKTTAFRALMQAELGGGSEVPSPADVDLGSTELLIYTRDGKLTSIWHARLGAGQVQQLHWLAPSTLVALFQESGANSTSVACLIARVTSSKPQVSTVPTNLSGASVELSPNGDAVLIACDGALYLVRNSGIAASVSFSQEKHPYGIAWSADGSQPCLSEVDEDSKRAWFTLADSSLVPLAGEPELYKRSSVVGTSKAAPLRLVEKSCSAAQSRVNVTLKGLWLEAAGDRTKQTPCLVTGDAVTGELSPNCDAVLYITADGAAFVRSIVAVDKARMTAVREQALKTQTLSEAKQVGLALLMYSTDHNDQLPQPGDFANSLADYAGRIPAGALDSFQFTYAGSSLTSIDQPATTVMGYLPGPGGVAALYADSHVEWKSTSEK